MLAEYAKELYLQIITIIKIKEIQLKENQGLRVTLLHYPEFEITEIGRLGNEYLFFSGNYPESFETTLLLPAEPTPIKIDVVDLGMALPSKIKKKIGFCGDISCSQ